MTEERFRPANVSFDVVGLPAQQGSKSVMPNGKAVEGSSTSGRAKTKAWRTAVAERSREIAEAHGQITGPTSITLTLRFPRPKSRPKKHHGWHTVKPDKDKVLRACLDGLTAGGLIVDDNQVCRISVAAVETDGWTGAQFQLSSIYWSASS